MFCVVFVFSCILQVLEEKTDQIPDYNDVSKNHFLIDSIPINFEFKEREVGKNSLFLERIQNEYVSVI
jgi:hypothetical protein